MIKIKILKIAAYILSVAGAYVVGFQYADMICGMHHRGFSAPPELALYVYGAQFGLAVLTCWLFAFFFERREKRKMVKSKKEY